MSTITATAFQDWAPSPRARVDVDGVPSGHTVTVYRMFEGIETIVRDAENEFASGGFTVTDYEIPPGVLVTYRVQVTDDLGELVESLDAAPVEVWWDPSLVCISDPTDPARAVLVEAKGTFGSKLSRSRPTSKYQVGDRTVALLGVRGKLRDVPLAVQTKTAEDADALADVLAATNVLVRIMPPMRMPRLLYVSVPDVDEIEMDVQFGGEWVVWDLVGDEISSPALGVVVPVYTWQSIIDAFTTWDDVLAAYVSWNDLLRNPPEVS